MESSVLKDVRGGFIVTTRFSEIELAASHDAVARRAIEIIAESIAGQYLDAYGSEVLKVMSPEAIAQMAIAEAGAAVNDTLKKKLPDKIVEVTRTEKEVYQRGIFGNLRRIR